ncbi:MAG: branched-chain amino acid ABC transporter permease [Deltaproteobacteria bacterium]|nr:branched-chain amino acid ABC transporter permease [Deltaproteobacteria bacterium]
MTLMQIYLPLIATGLGVGSLYGLVAFGMVLILKGTHVFNFAQFQCLTLGAYVAYSLMANNILPFVPAVIVAGFVGFAVGVLTYYLVVRHMQGHSLFSVFAATFGVALMIRAVMASIWGYQNKTLPIAIGHKAVSFGEGVSISAVHLIIFGVTILFIGTFIAFFNKTLLGTQMRAVANDQEVAHMMGINVNKVYVVTWGVAIFSSAIGGVFLSVLETVNVNLGDVGMKAFPVVILGGMESIMGSIIAGLIIGVLEVLAGYWFGAAYRQLVVFTLLLVVLMIRPYGLFGERHAQRV